MTKKKNEVRTELNTQQMASYIRKTNRNSRNKMYHY